MNAGVLLRIAAFNVVAHKVRTFLVAGIVAFGTLLVVVGNSLLDSVTVSMSRSVVESVSGHLQLYSAKAKDDLALFGGMMMGAEDLGEIDNFAVLRDAIAGLPNVAAVVPMGLDTALVYTGNAIDTALSGLREAVRSGKSADVMAKKAHVREIVRVLQQQLGSLDEVAEQGALTDEEWGYVERANTDSFWTGFDQEPLEALEFLENRIAPLSLGERLNFFRYLGTDPQAYAERFPLFEVAKGEMIPPGQRGFLFNDWVYENINKHPTARRIDRVARERENGRSLAEDVELQQLIARNARQVNDILLQLDAEEGEAVERALRRHLGTSDAGVSRADVLRQFLAFEENNFDERKRVFYEAIAPTLQLHPVPVGGTITLTSYGRSGYVRSANVKVFGTFKFKSLEKSALSGSFNLLDMATFRELYGVANAATRQEVEALKAKAGAKQVDRENVEDALFGGDSEDDPNLPSSAAAELRDGFDEFAGVDMGEVRKLAERLASQTFTPEQLAQGVALNAAVLLDDPTKLAETRAAIEKAAEAVGMPVKTATWEEASGLVGQFISVTRLSLYSAIAIIFVVALLIVNIATLMAALERVSEIGTMRAIGAGRGFVLALILVESVLVAVLGGAIGAALGGGLIIWLGQVGIPAFSDIFYFLFSGPRLYPALTAGSLGMAVVVLLGVSVLAALYPALIATRITPLSAISTEG